MPSSRYLLWLALLALNSGCTVISGVYDLEFEEGGGGPAAVGGMGGTTSAGGSSEGGSSSSGAGGVGGSGGGEMTCQTVADCPATGDPCIAALCLDNLCGTIPVAPNTPLLPGDQTPGDCQLAACDGLGGVLQLDDDLDLPDDNNDCTTDECASGMVVHVPVSLGSECAQGGNVCDAGGSCVQCIVPADCVGLPPDDECQVRTCVAGVCGQTFTPMGTPVSVQTAGNCSELVCDGTGSVMPVVDDGDVPVDGLDCTADVCTMGVPSNPPEASGTTCAAGVCDANGACVGCITASDCGTDTFCQAFTCTASVCGVVNAGAGTALPPAQQSAGNCVELQCNGNGATQPVPDDDDLPIDDGNDCTDEVCNAGVPSHPNRPLDAVCSSTGIVCDGQGTCVACNSPSQCAQGEICETATCNANQCGLVDTPNMTTAPSSAQTSGDCTVVLCDGMGGTTNGTDLGDVPYDANECTQDVCTGTTPSNPPQASGTPCQEGSGICDGMGMCSLLSPNGAPCSAPSQCLSGFCVDGVCCGTACTGSCEACSAAKNGGTNGTCGPVPAGQDPDGECAGVCDGALACVACDHVWSGVWGGGSREQAYGVAVDGNGDTIVVGQYRSGNVSFGAGNLPDADGMDGVFVAKRDANGNHLWANGYVPADGDAIAWGVAVDTLGDVYVVGETDDPIDFGGGNIGNGGGRDAFVLKLDSNGNHLWSAAYGAGNHQVAKAVAITDTGGVAVTGWFAGTIDFGGGVLPAGGGEDLFVVELDNSGGHLWSASFGGSNDDSGEGIAVDGAGNVVVTGIVRSSVDFGGGSLPFGGGADVFVASFDTNGTHAWSHAWGDGDTQEGLDVAADAMGNVVLTGRLDGVVDFGGGPRSSPGSAANAFLVKLDNSGSHVWSKSFGDSNDQEGEGVAIDAQGNVLVAGFALGSTNFGGGALVASGTKRDAFYARFTSGGLHLCSALFGDTGHQEAHAIATGPLGGFVIAGHMEDTIDFGGGPLSSGGGDDAFAATFAP